MADLPKEWEAIVQGANHGVAVRLLVERCYALHTKPVRELTCAEWNDIWRNHYDATASVKQAMEKMIAAAQRKQQEPETVELILRTYRKPDGGYETLTNEYPGNEMWSHVATTKLEVTLP